MVALLSLATLIPIPIAAQSTAQQTAGSIDPATCSAINDQLRAHPEAVAASQRSAIGSLSNDGCRLVIDVVGPPTLAFGPAAVAAATSCKYTHRELNIYSGPIETYTAHDEAYVCWNGTKAWQQDYRYCYVSAYPLGFGGSDSCVVINNNTSVITLRNAFWISTYALPTWKRYGWMSYTVNKNGAVSAVSGFCCN